MAPTGSVKRFRGYALLGLVSLSSAACVVTSYRVEVKPVDLRNDFVVSGPVKAHLTDGSTAVYATGVTASGSMLRGTGVFYDIALKPFPANPVLRTPLDSIAAIETFEARVNRAKTLAWLPLSIPLSVLAIGARGGGGTLSRGTTPGKFSPAQRAQGVTGRINTDRRPIVGELVEVRDDGIIVLDQKLRILPYSTIIGSDFDQVASRYTIGKQRPPTPEALEHLRLLSRFPQGLSPNLLQRLLQLQGQTALASATD